MRFAWRYVGWLMLAPFAGLAVAAAQTSTPLPGYLDPKTGIFTVIPATAPSIAPAASPVVIQGKVIIKVDATIKSAIPTDATLKAIGTASVNDGTYQGSAGNQFKLTRSGNTAKGSLTLTYLLAAVSASDKMDVQLIISVSSSSGPRPFIQLKQIIPLPKSKSTTTITFPVTL